MSSIINQIQDAWNSQADEFNQWDALGCDEKLDFAIGFVRMRVITDAAAYQSALEIIAKIGCMQRSDEEELK